MKMTMHILVIDVKIPTRLIRDARDGDSALGGYMGDGATGLDTHHEPVGSGSEASTQRYGGSWQRGFLLSER